MMKAFSFFAFIFVGTSILLQVHVGGGGMSSTQLNGAINAAVTTITVDSTLGFAPSGVIWIDNEQINYTGQNAAHTQFTGCTRASNGTDADSHTDNSIVRAEDNAVLNSNFGFDVGGLFDTWGFFAFPVVAVRFISQTIPYMMQGNIGNIFQGDGLAFIVDLWLTMGAGFIFMIVMALINARRGAG